MNILSGLYGRVVRISRARYEKCPARRRRLRGPVVSVGNLSVGGAGKTPVVAALARVLLDAGRHPAILSRGYRRRHVEEGVVVVSDGHEILQPVAVSGDEPQMLARALPDVPVLVCADRHLAGRLAQDRLGVDVCLLDDGFQHWQLARDIDLLLLGVEDLSGTLLPVGRLREPLDAASRADALLVSGDAQAMEEVRDATRHPKLFRVVTGYEPPRLVCPYGGEIDMGPSAVAAVAAIARPARFFSALAAAGWDVRRQIVFDDHHWFSRRDVESIAAQAEAAGASAIVTTEKDAVRLEPLLAKDRLARPPGPGAKPWIYLPMHVSIEPAAEFRGWLLDRLVGSAGATQGTA